MTRPRAVAPQNARLLSSKVVYFLRCDYWWLSDPPGLDLALGLPLVRLLVAAPTWVGRWHDC